MMQRSKVLIVEDELIAAEFLKEILLAQGVEVVGIVDSGKEAIARAIALKPDVIFMDIMLKDSVSGSEAALAISKEIDTKIIFVTAYVDDEAVDYAVASHAFGYLTKPYNEMQIITTLRLALSQKKDVAPKEMQAQKVESIELIDGYRFDFVHQRLFKNGEQVPLGAKSLKLLTLLCEHPDISVSNEQISMHVWGEAVNDRTLRSLMFRIRSQTSENLIKNVSGTGYMVQSAEK